MVLGYHIFAAVHKFFEVKCVRWLVENKDKRLWLLRQSRFPHQRSITKMQTNYRKIHYTNEWAKEVRTTSEAVAHSIHLVTCNTNHITHVVTNNTYERIYT
ncbi:Uncharacterised protein [Chlamydia trachomatis]|nr:Uncharacterised protein [Chlamydia trachomatis]